MTRRMVAALANPHLDVLGHMTGRMTTGQAQAPRVDVRRRDRLRRRAAHSTRPSRSTRRPERQDPPKRLLRLAVEAGCRFTIDTDAHAPGQLAWLRNGASGRSAAASPRRMVLNALPADEPAAWTASHDG